MNENFKRKLDGDVAIGASEPVEKENEGSFSHEAAAGNFAKDTNSQQSQPSEPNYVNQPNQAPVQLMEQQAKRPVWGYWLAIVLLAVISVFLFMLLSESETEKDRLQTSYRYAQSELEELSEQYETLKTDYESNAQSQKALFSTVSNKYPILITDMKFANVDFDLNIIDDFGTTIYSYNTKYIQPKIYFTGLADESVTLCVKFFQGESLSTSSENNSNSYIGRYSFSTSIQSDKNAEQEATLLGWGSNTSGHWSSGSYRVEVWYEDVCLCSKKFTIY